MLTSCLLEICFFNIMAVPKRVKVVKEDDLMLAWNAVLGAKAYMWVFRVREFRDPIVFLRDPKKDYWDS